MLVAFIKRINKEILDKDANLKKGIASLYASIYSAPPWCEEWTQESALAELEEVIQKEGFAGVIAEKTIDLEKLEGARREIDSLSVSFLKELVDFVKNPIVAFSWGYKVPEENTSRVPFGKIRAILSDKNIDPNRAFYGADTGVKPELREKGLATLLLAERSKASNDCNTVIFRTKNPQMLRIYRNALGEEIFSFPEESAYKEGRVYVFELRK